MRHIISLLLENEPGALVRVAGLFTARGYNIESLSVAATHDPEVSRMTLSTRGDERIVEQIVKQLNKLIEVIKVIDISESPHAERELMLIKLAASSGAAREEARRLAEMFRGQVIDITTTTLVIEVVGGTAKLAALLAAVDESSVMEVVRSGPCAISRGKKGLHL